MELKVNNYRTDIIEETLPNLNEEILKRNLNITLKDFEALQYYLLKMSDGYYYSKPVDNDELCNEIIGRYLCRSIDLDTTSLEIIKKIATGYRIITPNYRKPKLQYFLPQDNFFFGDYTEYFDDKYFKDLPPSLKHDVMKMLAVDIAMEQTDRYARNMEVYLNTSNEQHLSPAIDFVYAYENYEGYIYFNPYLIVNKKKDALFKLCNKYPDLYPYLEKLFSLEIEELLSDLSLYDIMPSNKLNKSIKITAENNKKLLKSLK